MLLSRLGRVVSALPPCVGHQVKRNIGLTSAMCQTAKLDPIQQLFINKTKEYEKRQKTSPDGLVDATDKIKAELRKELEKVNARFHADKEDLLKMPTFHFAEEYTENVFPPATAPKPNIYVEDVATEDDAPGYPDENPFNREKLIIF